MMQLTEQTTLDANPKYWMRGLPGQIATGLCGVIAIFVAIKAAAYQTNAGDNTLLFDQFIRLLSFAALTVWVTFTIGVKRRGTAAMIVLAFATFLELVIVPLRADGPSTIVAANLGIVLAYCATHLYGLSLFEKRVDDGLQATPSKD